ncbi:MAG TPA: hypothetical protein VEX86_21330, partial [Longimicrobium sp.]|nr:hypothetical protein [Longimicrobium sp.]
FPMSAFRSTVRRLRLALPLAILSLLGACRGRAQTAEAQRPAEHAGIDWSQVTSRDLNIASVFLVARDRGVRPALDSLAVLTRGDPRLDLLGHQVAHAVGRFAVAQRGYDAAVFAECRPTFLSGCYHGVLEGWLAGHPNADAASLRGLCSSAAMAALPPYAFRECAHGLGHGLTAMREHNLFAALPDCDTALSTELARRECYDGVFMENVVHSLGSEQINVGDAAASHHAHRGGDRKLLKAGDPRFPCDSVTATHAPSCWAYQPVVFFGAYNDDMGRILRACDAAPAGSRAACYRGIGKQTIGRMPQRADSVVRVCARASGAHSADCLGGVVEFYVDQEWKADSAFAFCAGVPGGMREACFRAVGERVAWIDPSPEALRTACTAAGPHAAACLAAAQAQRAGDALPRAAAVSPPAARPAASPTRRPPATPPPAPSAHNHPP